MTNNCGYFLSFFFYIINITSCKINKIENVSLWRTCDIKYSFLLTTVHRYFIIMTIIIILHKFNFNTLLKIFSNRSPLHNYTNLSHISLGHCHHIATPPFSQRLTELLARESLLPSSKLFNERLITMADYLISRTRGKEEEERIKNLRAQRKKARESTNAFFIFFFFFLLSSKAKIEEFNRVRWEGRACCFTKRELLF